MTKSFFDKPEKQMSHGMYVNSKNQNLEFVVSIIVVAANIEVYCFLYLLDDVW